MAKSTRSKVKRSFRSKKRQSGVFAATEAARLQRLNLKLHQMMRTDEDGDAVTTAVEENADHPAHTPSASQNQPDDADSMQVDVAPQPKRISTHGPRGSRREEWRKSKGMTTRSASRRMNRQGGVAARRKPGRSQRRR